MEKVAEEKAPYAAHFVDLRPFGGGLPTGLPSEAEIVDLNRDLDAVRYESLTFVLDAGGAS